MAPTYDRAVKVPPKAPKKSVKVAKKVDNLVRDEEGKKVNTSLLEAERLIAEGREDEAVGRVREYIAAKFLDDTLQGIPDAEEFLKDSRKEGGTQTAIRLESAKALLESFQTRNASQLNDNLRLRNANMLLSTQIKALVDVCIENGVSVEGCHANVDAVMKHYNGANGYEDYVPEDTDDEEGGEVDDDEDAEHNDEQDAEHDSDEDAPYELDDDVVMT